MKNTFGNALSVTLFGESHGEYIGAVLDGIAPGTDIDTDYIRAMLEKRMGPPSLSTKRREPDRFSIISGVKDNKSTGTPICILIPNEDIKSRDYDAILDVARPGHADYSGYIKYHGYEDRRGGGHFSGRLTAALTAAGAIAKYALEKHGVTILTHILRCGGIEDSSFYSELEKNKALLNENELPMLERSAERKFIETINAAKAENDSIGGVLQTGVWGMPAGVGEPWFDSLEGVLAHAIFSIPAIKGIEFGKGFMLSDMKGSAANDEFTVDADGNISTLTNNNGGINGGISNGMPIVFQCAVKPTPSIGKPQRTVNFIDKTECEIKITGRHDPAIVHRVGTVVESVTALVLYDMLAMRYGTDYLR